MVLKIARELACLVCSALVVAIGIPTHAHTSSSLPPAVQEAVNSAAQEAVQKGLSAAKQGDYLGAINHFQEALRLAPNSPEIFFYLGVAEARIAGRELRAICWLGAYLSASPNGSNAEAVQNQISKLKIAHQKTLSVVLKSVEDAARFSELKGPSLRDVARRWASIGDLTSALQTAANLTELPESQAEAYAAIAEIQAKSLDIAGALTTG
jgi:tetratricopeptide (TPR) repeat protein